MLRRFCGGFLCCPGDYIGPWDAAVELRRHRLSSCRVLEHVAQTPLVLAGVYDTHNSVSLVNDKMRHKSDENSDENLASADDKFLVMI